ncbi:MAG: isoprenyl transferase [Lentisphaerae bacterium]|jgi:undecaprenyl diphosphate synthase|nr:isoprenyl transferase [Victivallaceae bacterium]MDD3703138.1 isoprenyl transferase [Victivallaceae bacterium]MDD5663424.1 isoprenyl transferase [Victivallaceae bacterium]NLK83098.1 isoprenyl transferase [Lentisphaerota bacterium]
MKNKKINHIAIIMDGNGRWAEERKLPHLEGHRKGAEAVKKVIEASNELGLKYLTLYAFSTENWNRPKEEVDGLMDILVEFLDDNLQILNDNKIKLVVIGRLWQLTEKVKNKLSEAVESTAGNDSGTLVLAINYGGRAEIVDATKAIVKKVIAGEFDVESIDEEIFSMNLYAPNIPDPDLLIRTSGEFRISNFLLWELSYSEFYISDVYWPDFNSEELNKALENFYARDRRFGGRK